MPQFSEARHDDETVELETDDLRLAVHRRRMGWGWGELFAPTADGERYLGVVEHFGEVDCERFPRPLQLVADDVETGDGVLRFDLRVQDLPDIEDFRDEEYDEEPEFTGRLELAATEAGVSYDLTVTAETDVDLTRLRGPWLRVGADGFGADRDDGIFPGIDWVTGDEWSSGNDYVEHPNALRVAPHPNKVAVPTMAVSEDDVAVSLSWDVSDDDDELGRPQPVYATPNFVDRRDDSLLGLMRPGADVEALPENELDAEDPVSMAAGQSTTLSATVSVTEGASLDAVVDWVQRNGLPEPGTPRYDWTELVDWLAECYATNLWHEGEGYGADVGMLDGGSPSVPSFLRKYVDREGADSDLVARIEDQIEWCEAQSESDDGDPEFDLGRTLSPAMSVAEEDAEALGERLLDIRRDDGAFVFDPDGRHHNFRSEWFDYSRPLGQPGETELGFCVEGGAALLLVGRKTGEQRFTDAGLETLEFATRFEKPAGDDWWETPIHGPNLFAGGKAAIAFALAHEETGDEAHRERARTWLRSLLPFTHLWEPSEMEMLYNTKPCLDASVWTVVSWVNNHVIWEVLTVFQQMNDLGVDPAEIDPDIDWDRYQRGITTAVLRWIVDSRADDEYLDRFQFPEEELRAGEFDGLYADVYDPVGGAYAGGPIVPNVIGENALMLLDRDGE